MTGKAGQAAPQFPRTIAPAHADLVAARQWAMQFVQWYNHEHRHSGIRYVTPAQRHARCDRRLLEARHAVYQSARERNPRRWSGNTRNWTIRLRDGGPMARDKAFRALFFAALIAGVAAGAVASVIQAGKMWPLIGTVSRIKAAIAA